MSARITLATAGRVLAQLRRDPRTLALLVLVPCGIVTLLKYLFEDQPATFDRVGVPLLGLFPFITLFLVTSIAMQRERASGTLERLMAGPAGKLDLMAGYGLAFAGLAVVQAGAVSALAFGALGLDTPRSAWPALALAAGNAVLGVGLGLLASAFASSEFQAVQFMPALVLPQLLLCGLFVPRERMAGWLEVISDALPLTYAYDALARVAAPAPLGGAFWLAVGVTLGATALALVLAAATLRRRTA